MIRCPKKTASEGQISEIYFSIDLTLIISKPKDVVNSAGDRWSGLCPSYLSIGELKDFISLGHFPVNRESLNAVATDIGLLYLANEATQVPHLKLTRNLFVIKLATN